MKGNDRNQRAALTLLFGGVIFGILLAVVIVSGVTLAVLLRTGALDLVRLNPGGKYAFILMMAVISIVLGGVFAYLFGRLFMQPVNEVINAMNRLASGDFKTRIRFRSAGGHRRQRYYQRAYGEEPRRSARRGRGLLRLDRTA